ncbi:hypothetical protein BIW11_13766 [Tropilaelaps mercedesae]|uniref:Uncharacterized protein n=1 Tax=Tropilaelaps mercedesae TaxID=418985 RepID=A0A1V9X0E5_9ACAR|nr:hypothetical protein BIW11_13766 [Tropilaelaps mercedesae]
MKSVMAVSAMRGLCLEERLTKSATALCKAEEQQNGALRGRPNKRGPLVGRVDSCSGLNLNGLTTRCTATGGDALVASSLGRTDGLGSLARGGSMAMGPMGSASNMASMAAGLGGVGNGSPTLGTQLGLNLSLSPLGAPSSSCAPTLYQAYHEADIV